ncbi:MAG: IS1182 family transposase [Paucibacter sp.]|nr:IS1182 family transposase [Roseateles sp.]
MPTSYLPYEPDQQFLLPPSIQEWLPSGHLAHYINDTVDALDLSAFFKRYEGGGSRNQPFHPAMMVKVLVYGYATGVFSSRKIARKLHEDVAFRVLAAGNFPKHRTISDFRALHLQELAALFVQVVKLAAECGLVKLGTIAVDGTKLRANASKHKAMSYQRMQAAEVELKAQINTLLKRAAQADKAEANEPELDIPAEIERRQERLAVIAAAKQRLEQRQREVDDQRGRKPGDTPDTQAKHKREDDDDADPGAPTQEDHAPANAASSDQPPSAQAKKRGRAFKRPYGEPPPKAQENFTDPDSRIMKTSTGFEQCFNAQTAVDAQAQIIVAAELGNFATDVAQLPAMLAAVERDTGQLPDTVLADAGYRSEAVLAQLSELPCEVIVALGREGKAQAAIDTDKYPHTAAMAVKLQTKEGQDKYRRRKAIVEPPNSWIKRALGFQQFSFRGLEKARCELKLVCAALNLRRMATMRV